jgi:hypothetical protein
MEQEATTISSRLWRLCGCGDGATAADRRNSRAITIWSLVWAVVFLVALATMESYGDESLAVSIAALAAAALATIPLIRAYVRFVREADELARMIQVQAMAVAFCAGFVVATLGRFLERVISLIPELAPFDLMDFLNPLMVMIVAYSLSVLVLQRRYSR